MKQKRDCVIGVSLIIILYFINLALGYKFFWWAKRASRCTAALSRFGDLFPATAKARWDSSWQLVERHFRQAVALRLPSTWGYCLMTLPIFLPAQIFLGHLFQLLSKTFQQAAKYSLSREWSAQDSSIYKSHNSKRLYVKAFSSRVSMLTTRQNSKLIIIQLQEITSVVTWNEKKLQENASSICRVL